ncbi:general secretion pathway protein GspB [Desulfosarcina sp.]|uniref:general secretion pathway protein GspB n=1 Tax=Desulfosarcina sp. TaxID=2027861 RepID=UPI003970739E
MTNESASAPPDATTRGLPDASKVQDQSMQETLDSAKTFRNDPRIDLQALVWAPQAAERFVVINNRLIKEGGSVDNIMVVAINPDDVLLAEGSDRWHEEFKVR